MRFRLLVRVLGDGGDFFGLRVPEYMVSEKIDHEQKKEPGYEKIREEVDSENNPSPERGK